MGVESGTGVRSFRGGRLGRRTGSVTWSALTDAALPDERLSADELLACCWEDPGVVLGSAAGDGRGVGGDAARSATAHARVRQAARRASRRAASRSRIGAAGRGRAVGVGPGRHASCTCPAPPPPTCGPASTCDAPAMLCLAEAAGYDETGAAFDMSVACRLPRTRCPTASSSAARWTTPTAAAVEASGRRRVAALAGRGTGAASSRAPASPPSMSAPARRSASPATRSTGRAGSAPPAPRPPHLHRGIGLALLGEVCADLHGGRLHRRRDLLDRAGRLLRRSRRDDLPLLPHLPPAPP